MGFLILYVGRIALYFYVVKVVTVADWTVIVKFCLRVVLISGIPGELGVSDPSLSRNDLTCTLKPLKYDSY